MDGLQKKTAGAAWAFSGTVSGHVFFDVIY